MGEEDEGGTVEEILEALARLVERGEVVVRGALTASPRQVEVEIQ